MGINPIIIGEKIMITENGEKQTAKQYVNARFESYISIIYVSVLNLIGDEDDLMNDEYFTDALHFFHTEESDLKAMTLRERKQVVEQLRKQTNRLIKIVDPKSGYYPELERFGFID
tara:strand:+ start:117 stop:464 length:348 start_codon:yes stop_codon:yes gene_type:complete